MGKKDDEDVTMRQRLEDERKIKELRAIEESRQRQIKVDAEKEAERKRQLQAAIDRAVEEAKRNKK